MNPIAESTPPDFADHVARLRALADDPHPLLRELFVPGRPVLVARAPGRLDVMGGIGDYSGSLVLEMPIAEAAFAAVQPSAEPGVTVASLPQQPGEEVRIVAIAAEQWAALAGGDYQAAQQTLHEAPQRAWAAYALGPLLVLLHETSARLTGGLRILIDSHVPEGKGVSSSAAVEVAVMRSVAALTGQNLDPQELARLCQVAENRVVGAPCGIMDQMTSALGRQGELLALLCQPATVEGYVPIPREVAFWGIDSGIRHAVSGSDYTSVRTGAFMGYRIIADAAGLAALAAGDVPGAMDVADPLWNGYLANVTPAEFHARFADAVPRDISGREFLDRYGGTTDRVTRVDPARTYAVREPTLHPIGEHQRARRFRELLQGTLSGDSLREMGELMDAAHASYSACGLASDGTDQLVELVRELGPESGLYGAKITGGGSGGTVAVLGRADAGPIVDDLARRYAECTGRETYVFRGSSPGACATAVMEIAL